MLVKSDGGKGRSPERFCGEEKTGFFSRNFCECDGFDKDGGEGGDEAGPENGEDDRGLVDLCENVGSVGKVTFAKVCDEPYVGCSLDGGELGGGAGKRGIDRACAVVVLPSQELFGSPESVSEENWLESGADGGDGSDGKPGGLVLGSSAERQESDADRGEAAARPSPERRFPFQDDGVESRNDDDDEAADKSRERGVDGFESDGLADVTHGDDDADLGSAREQFSRLPKTFRFEKKRQRRERGETESERGRQRRSQRAVERLHHGEVRSVHHRARQNGHAAPVLLPPRLCPRHFLVLFLLDCCQRL